MVFEIGDADFECRWEEERQRLVNQQAKKVYSRTLFALLHCDP